jgi:hypothetical protein
MTGYVVSGRIDRGRPRIAAPARPPAAPPDRAPGAEPLLFDISSPGQRDMELRWEAVRERWAQLTFFLFDPESWR